MSFLSKIQVTSEVEAVDVPLGERYPRAKGKLSDSDIAKLDKLFYTLNRAQRYTPEFDSTVDDIEKILGVRVA